MLEAMANANATGALIGGMVTSLVGFILLVVVLSIKDAVLTGDNATVEVDGLTLTLVDMAPWFFGLLIIGGLVAALVGVFQGIGGRR